MPQSNDREQRVSERIARIDCLKKVWKSEGSSLAHNNTQTSERRRAVADVSYRFCELWNCVRWNERNSIGRSRNPRDWSLLACLRIDENRTGIQRNNTT